MIISESRMNELEWKERKLQEIDAVRASRIATTCRKCGDKTDVKIEYGWLPNQQEQEVLQLKARLEELTASLQRQDAPEVAPPADFEGALRQLINYYSQERGSDTPDFVLAHFLDSCLLAFDQAVRAREDWYGQRPTRVPAEDSVEKIRHDYPWLFHSSKPGAPVPLELNVKAFMGQGNHGQQGEISKNDNSDICPPTPTPERRP